MENLKEEIADVIIVVKELMMMFDCADDVTGYIDYKVERLRANIEREKDGVKY